MESTHLIVALVAVIFALVGLVAYQQFMYHKMISELSLKIMSGTGEKFVINRAAEAQSPVQREGFKRSEIDPSVNPDLVDLDSVPEDQIDDVIEAIGR